MHNATALVMFAILAVDADTVVAFSLVTLLLALLVTLDSYSPKEVMIIICDHLVAKCPWFPCVTPGAGNYRTLF